MRIALVCPTGFSYPGGIQKHIQALTDELIRRRHSVRIFAPRATLHSTSYLEENYGENVILMGGALVIPGNASRVSVSGTLDLLPTVEEILEREDLDIIHFHEPLTPFLSWQILLASKSANVATFHCNVESSFFLKTFPFLVRPFQEMLYPRLHAAIAVSEVAVKFSERAFRRKIHIIPNGIDLKRYHPRVRRLDEFCDGKVNILFVGRFDERKGLPYLLEAYALLRKQFHNLRLILVGDGPEKEKAQRIIKNKKLKNVVFVGAVMDEDLLPRYYASCDLFCSPATKGESFGMVLLEAMACGKPVVAFDNVGYRTQLVGELGQFLVPVGDTKALSVAMGRLAGDAKLRSKVGKAGIRHTRSLSWKGVVDEILQVYKEALRIKRNGEK